MTRPIVLFTSEIKAIRHIIICYDDDSITSLNREGFIEAIADAGANIPKDEIDSFIRKCNILGIGEGRMEFNSL